MKEEIKTIVYYYDEKLNITTGTLDFVPDNAIRATILQRIPFNNNGVIDYYLYEHNIYIGQEVDLRNSTNIPQSRKEVLIKNGYDRQAIFSSNISWLVKSDDSIHSTIVYMSWHLERIKEETESYQIEDINKGRGL